VFGHDVTERKQAEGALRVANERLEMAQRAAGAGIWDWDITTVHIEWSPQMFELFGLDPQKATASFETWEAVLHPEDKESASAPRLFQSRAGQRSTRPRASGKQAS
jgi:PAS domain-containing protein